MKGCEKIADNGQGLAKFWNLENVRPEPMPIKDKKVKLTNQSQIEKRQAGTEAQQRTKAEVITSCQNFAKPNVIGMCQLRFNLLG